MDDFVKQALDQNQKVPKTKVCRFAPPPPLLLSSSPASQRCYGGKTSKTRSGVSCLDVVVPQIRVRIDLNGLVSVTAADLLTLKVSSSPTPSTILPCLQLPPCGFAFWLLAASKVYPTYPPGPRGGQGGRRQGKEKSMGMYMYIFQISRFRKLG
jgi:hypothetical protein